MSPDTLSSGQLRALVRLLGDDDDGIRDHARARLLAAGESAVPLLEKARLGDAERAVRAESDALLDTIRFDRIERDWVRVQAAADEKALLEGAFLLERWMRPERAAAQERAREELDVIAAGAREAVRAENGRAPLSETVPRFLHESCGFHGNVEHYYDPENSYLSSVLERRTGIPITLALVYLVVGRWIGAPFVGIGMPMHFLVGIRDGEGIRYLDPFHGGREVSRGECLLALERAGLERPEAYLRPTPVVAILERMARNLIVIYHHAAAGRELERARRFASMLTGDPG